MQLFRVSCACSTKGGVALIILASKREPNKLYCEVNRVGSIAQWVGSVQFKPICMQAPAWPNNPAEFSKQPRAVPFQRQSQAFARPAELTVFGRLAEACLRGAAEQIIEAAAQLDNWDKRC